jgi:hypothetical protein
VSELLALDRPEAQLMVFPAEVHAKGAELRIDAEEKPQPVEVIRAKVLTP